MNGTAWMDTVVREHTQLQSWILPSTIREWTTGPHSLASLADGFDPISLNEMNSVALLDRTDTKFVMSTGQLSDALAALQPSYHILSVNGQRLNHYRTLYFDTVDFQLYLWHVNGRAERYKVRSREYTDSCQSYLEVKHRTRKDRTIKQRLSTAYPLAYVTREAEHWLSGVFPYDSRALEPKIWDTFTRITLVSKQHCERVTLDVNLGFSTADKAAYLDGIVVAEAKLDSRDSASPFLAQMRAQRVRPRGFSKYCIGVSLLCDGVKKNALKSQILWIQRMTAGVANYE